MPTRCLARDARADPCRLEDEYLKALISAGFKHIDAVSFVSPKAVPQMADSEEVLKELDPPDDVEIIGIVVNEQGRAAGHRDRGRATLGFPLFDFADTFLQNNQNQIARGSARRTRKDSEEGRVRRDSTSWSTSPWHSAILMATCGTSKKWSRPSDLLEADRSAAISLADTVGLASQQQISDLVGAVHAKVRLPGDWRAPAQPSRAGCGQDPGRLRCGLPPL